MPIQKITIKKTIMRYLRILTKRIVFLLFSLVFLLGANFNTLAQSTKQVGTTGISMQEQQIDHKRRDDFHRRDNHKKDDYRRNDKKIKPIVIYPMAEDHFNIFLSKIKKVSFKDCKMTIVEVGCINNYFTCRQVLSIMKLFSFDDEKMQVLKIMNPNILDKENGEMLAEHFTFDSSKKQAMTILNK